MYAQSLDGFWQFVVDPEGTLKVTDLSRVTDWRQIRVPLSWNAQFADLRDYRGVAWYRKLVTIAPRKADQTVLIEFGAVDYLAEVFINGQPAGTHEGGYLPFTFDISALTRAGENEVLVRVTDPDASRTRWGEMNFDELPHGKQSWYVQTGGIWQSAKLDLRTGLYIENVHVTPRNTGEVNVQVRLAGKSSPDPNPIRVTVRNASGQVEFTTGGGGITTRERAFDGRVKSPQLWSPANPALYSVEVSLPTIGDSCTYRFGFRSFEPRDGKLFLNGKPIYIISALDQDFYPEGIYTPPSYEFLLDQMRKAKQLGLNMLRTHIKVPTPDYLRAADEVGILIWYEIPSWDDNTWTPAAAKRGEDIFLGELERDWNHPSVVIQSIINEAWGVRGLREEHTRKWLKEAFNRLQPAAARAGRLVVDNSPCCGNFHLKSDIADYHQYNSIPDNREAWDKWVADLASRPAWLWSGHGDAETTGREPMILSEFGNWGLPVLPRELPWWFERDFNGREVTRPAKVFDRFHDFKFDRLFGDFNDLAQATQRHQWISLKHEIEEIRRHASIQGYTITEFTDLNWECNGLLDMFRNKKGYADDLARIQQQNMLFARTPSRAFTSGEKIELTIYASRYDSAATTPQTIRCYLNDRLAGEVRIKAGEAGSVVKDETIALTAPAVPKPVRVRVKLELRGANNSLTAENYLELFIYPEPQKRSGELYLAGDAARMAEWLRPAGYTLAASPVRQAVIITDRLDAETRALLKSGHRVIVLANSKEALADGVVKLTPRNGSTGYDGNWVTNFNWVNSNRAPFSVVSFDKLLGFEAEAVMPKFVIEGVKAENYDDVMAGIFLGWINKNAALALGASSGDGRAIVTTLRLADVYGRDEYATLVLDEMIRLVRSADFTPQFSL